MLLNRFISWICDPNNSTYIYLPANRKHWPPETRAYTEKGERKKRPGKERKDDRSWDPRWGESLLSGMEERMEGRVKYQMKRIEWIERERMNDGERYLVEQQTCQSYKKRKKERDDIIMLALWTLMYACSFFLFIVLPYVHLRS